MHRIPSIWSLRFSSLLPSALCSTWGTNLRKATGKAVGICYGKKSVQKQWVLFKGGSQRVMWGRAEFPDTPVACASLPEIISVDRAWKNTQQVICFKFLKMWHVSHMCSARVEMNIYLSVEKLGGNQCGLFRDTHCTKSTQDFSPHPTMDGLFWGKL